MDFTEREIELLQNGLIMRMNELSVKRERAKDNTYEEKLRALWIECDNLLYRLCTEPKRII
jgi:hypothetical protein